MLRNDSFVNNMEAILKAIAEEILNPEIAFTQTEDEKKCNYCDFKSICTRERM